MRALSVLIHCLGVNLIPSAIFLVYNNSTKRKADRNERDILPPPPDITGRNRVSRAAWLTLGLACVALGAIGVVLPLLPTTIFLIIAAYAFARSSPRLHGWLMGHHVFGPVIKDWQARGAIGRKAKMMALISMGVIVALSVIFGAPRLVWIVQILVLVPVALFIVTRPE